MEKYDMDILVTGAGGWLGSELTEQLLLSGKKVKAVNFIYTDKLKELKKQYGEKLEVIIGDICDEQLMQKTLKGIKKLFHLAAKVHTIPTNEKEEEEFFRVNTKATEKIFEQCMENKVERVVFFSTVSVYKGMNEKITSTNGVKDPSTIYGKSKLRAEEIANKMWQEKKLPVTIIEPVTVYGQGDVGNFKKLENLIKKGVCIQFGNGDNKKTVIYYKDLIRMAIEISEKPELIGRTLICGTEVITVKDINNTLIEKRNKRTMIIRVPKSLAKMISKLCCFSILKKIRRKILALTSNSEFITDYKLEKYTSFHDYYTENKIYGIASMKYSHAKKVLFVATVTNHINAFHIPYLKMFKEKGYEVHVASFGDEPIEYCDKHFNIPFARFPLKLQNYKSYKELKKIIQENHYETIHCHTPVGGVLTRLAARKERKNGIRVIYTAHGFHFYKGAPLLNWIIFYPIEKYLSKYTDCLITINQEDYELAKKRFKKCKQIELVHGVGVDESKFNFKMTKEEKHELRESLGLKYDDSVLIQIGELNKNKNQILAIEAMKVLVQENPYIHLLLVGKGKLEKFYEEKIKEYNLENNVHMLGYRTDIPKLMKISDILLSLSYREGLPVNVIEGMFCGLPIIATDCRGNRDLVECCVKMDNIDDLNNKISDVLEKKSHNKVSEVNSYKLDNIMVKMKKIYNSDRK